MANTYVDYTGNGTLDTYSITFPYLSNSHVTVQVGGVTQTEATHYNITTGNVVFTSGNIPANSAAIRIKRVTERVTPLVDFKDGSTLLEADLDTANLQSFYIAQETDESAFQADSDGNYDASNNKLVNVGTPTASTDGATKGYVDTQVASKDALSELSGDLDDIAAGTTNKHFTATDETKLDGIETGADVTDATNVEAAGALMDSELTDLAGVKGVTISTLQPKPSEGAFADGDKTKLDGIASGAEVNVQSDWNASSGDAQILNKPTIPTNLADLSDVSSSAPSDGQVLKWSASGSTWEAGNDLTGSGGGGGATTFIGLSDTPSSFTAGKWLKVNSAGNALEEVDAPSDTDTTYTAGAGITLTSTEFSHSDTSTVADSDNANGTVVQDLTFDTYGHVQTVGTTDLDTRYSQTSHNHNSAYLQISNNLSDVTASTARTNLGLGDAATGTIGTDVQAYDADTSKTDVATEWTAAQNFNSTTLTFDATQDWDLSTNQVCQLTLTNNTTFDAPTNIQDGGFYSITLIQDGTGSRTAAWNAVFKWAGGTAPTLTTTASAKDIFVFRGDGTNLLEVGRQLNVS